VHGNKSSRTLILNFTGFINNGVWYKIALENVNYMTTTKLYDHDLIWISVKDDETLYVLLTDVKDSLVAFRGLCIKNPMQPENIQVESLPPEYSRCLLLLTVAFIMLMIITSVLIMIFLEPAQNQ